MNVVKTPGSHPDANRKLEQEIDRLARSIQKFRVEAQRFFAGDVKLPPEDLRERIAAELRRLRSSNLQGAAATFRLGTLESQFQSHLDLFGRRLRQREHGVAQQAAATKAAASAPLDPEKGVVVGPDKSSAAVEALYNRLYRQSSKMDLDRFSVYIAKQAEVIRDKTGCREIQFRVALQDGKMKLKAKPIRAGSKGR